MCSLAGSTCFSCIGLPQIQSKDEGTGFQSQGSTFITFFPYFLLLVLRPIQYIRDCLLHNNWSMNLERLCRSPVCRRHHLSIYSKCLTVNFILFYLQNTALLARRLLNGELEPAKILSMSPTELKVRDLLCYIFAHRYPPCFRSVSIT